MELVVELQSRQVFVTGEKVHCLIQLKNLSKQPQSIAWSSVQLQCECLLDEVGQQVVKSGKLDKTSYCPIDWTEGSQVITSAPKVLLCDLTLEEGQTKTYHYSDVIPGEAPPSYRGKNIKFRYNVLIGTQKVNSNIEMVKVPLRVLSSPNLMLMNNGHHHHNPHNGDQDPENKLSIANPFLSGPDSQQDSDTSLNDSGGGPLYKPQDRKSSSYDITASKGSIAKLNLLRTEFKLGDNILANFDFSKGEMRCIQYSACLLCEETVTSAEMNEHGKPKELKSRIRHGKFHDFCYGAHEASMCLEIPLHITPTFKSNLCSIAWMIQFEFVVSCDKSFDQFPMIPAGMGDSASNNPEQPAPTMNCEWNGPQQLQVQTLVWTLPITILPCDPYQVDTSLRNKNSFRFVVK